MKFKEIKILPSLWTLDVLIVEDEKDAIKFQVERYGIRKRHVDTEKNINSVTTMVSSKKSILKGETRIILILENLQCLKTIVHELVHVLWHFGRETGSEITFHSQEWQAILMEYLFDQVLKENYTELTWNGKWYQGTSQEEQEAGSEAEIKEKNKDQDGNDKPVDNQSTKQ